jgi:MFS family permease
MKTQKQSLFRRDFTMVVIGQIISLFGNAILRFALPLYLLRETGSSTLFGAVTACSFIPMILFSLVGGVWADRLNKRNVMVVLDFTTAVLILVFYGLNGQVPIVPLILVFLMLLYGISGAYQPTVQASIPALVQREQMMQGNAVINMVNTLSGLLGPVIGGVLFGAWGITPILLLSVGCFFCSAVMEIFIHIPYQKQPMQAGILRVMKQDWQESGRFVKREKPIFLSVVIVLALFNLVLSAAIIVGIPIMVVNVLGMSDASLGLTQGALGLGGLAGGCLGGVLGEKIKLRHGSRLLLFCSLTAALMGAALLPFVPPFAGYVLITAMSFAMMAASTLFSIQLCTVVQQQTPAYLVGKIMACMMAIANCASPLGQAVYGVLFDVCAAVPWLVMFGSAAIAFLISLYSKNVFVRLEKENVCDAEVLP